MKTIKSTAGHRATSQTSRRRVFHTLLLVSLIILNVACPLTSAKTSRLFPQFASDAGKLRLAEVMALATRGEILNMGSNLDYLLTSGLKDADFQDGSIAMARVMCCHARSDMASSIWFYIPSTLKVQVGDFVVVRMGRKPEKNDSGIINEAFEIREHRGAPDSQCYWDPPDETKWARVLFCKWMPAEGWTLKKRFIDKTWLKEDPNTKP